MDTIHSELDVQYSVQAGAAFERLFELTVLLGEHMERGLAERGLTRARAAVLWQLYHYGPVTQRVISQALRVTPRNVTGLVDALEADGFVARAPHPTDRRATLVTLTEHGSTVAAALHAEEQEGAGWLFAGVPAADLTRFVITLDRVLARLRSVVAVSADEPC